MAVTSSTIIYQLVSSSRMLKATANSFKLVCSILLRVESLKITLQPLRLARYMGRRSNTGKGVAATWIDKAEYVKDAFTLQR